MTMQTADKRLAQVSRSPSRSAGSGIAAPIVAAMCLLAGLIALGLLGQRGPGVGGSPAGADDSAAWIIGP